MALKGPVPGTVSGCPRQYVTVRLILATPLSFDFSPRTGGFASSPLSEFAVFRFEQRPCLAADLWAITPH